MEKTESMTIQKLYELGLISSEKDLIGDNNPSKLLTTLIAKYGYLLIPDQDHLLTEKEMKIRDKFTKLIKVVGPLALSNKQVIENRYKLMNENDNRPDLGINLPEHSVIWTPNHGFKDDPLATALAIYRNAYYLFASLPQFYNSLDGVLAASYGVVMMNRKVHKSRENVIPRCVSVLNHGKDMIIYPEGGLNKNMSTLVQHLWPGIYRIHCETGSPIVPVVHYLGDYGKKNLKNKLFPTENDIIHTVIDDPVMLMDLPEQAALDYLRDILATWFYLMMEKYGTSTRENILKGESDINVAWEKELLKLKSTMAFYDSEIETNCAYQPHDIVLPEEVYSIIEDLSGLDQNGNINKDAISHMAYAHKLVRSRQKEDFAHRI